jgi:hypothetical protein
MADGIISRATTSYLAMILYKCLYISPVLFMGGRRGTRTPKHFVNLTGESKKI